MAQVGIYSAYQLGLHSHLDNNNGGILNAYSRHGAYRVPYRAGALALHVDNDAEVFIAGAGVYTLLKQFTVGTVYGVATALAGVRFTWEMKNFDNLTNVAARVYINGVAVGAVQNNNTNVYVAKLTNYDAVLAVGDLLQIWGNDVGDSCYIRNFRVYYDWCIAYFGDGTYNRLTTTLPLIDADALDLTADF